MKKITFALAACVVFAFAACGGNATETATTDSTSHDSTPVEAPVTTDSTSVKDSAATTEAAPAADAKKEEVKK